MSGKPTPSAVITASVHAHLRWNALAYGNPWTGEYEDTAFICMDLVEALEKAGYKIVEIVEATDER